MSRSIILCLNNKTYHDDLKTLNRANLTPINIFITRDHNDEAEYSFNVAIKNISDFQKIMDLAVKQKQDYVLYVHGDRATSIPVDLLETPVNIPLITGKLINTGKTCPKEGKYAWDKLSNSYFKVEGIE